MLRSVSSLTILVCLSLENPTIVDWTEVPWYVTIRREVFKDGTFDYVFLCGGAIISRYNVITSAVCLNALKGNASDIYVQFATNTRDYNKGDPVAPIESFVMHESWTRRSMEHDIGLITVGRNMYHLSDVSRIKTKVKPISLPKEDAALPSQATVVGFGQDKTPFEYLHKYTLPHYDQTECEKLYSSNRPSFTIHDSQACYGAGGFSGCMGDKGGPLQADGILFGIVSLRFPCTDKNKPAAYTRVSAHLPWIKRHAKLDVDDAMDNHEGNDERQVLQVQSVH